MEATNPPNRVGVGDSYRPNADRRASAMDLRRIARGLGRAQRPIIRGTQRVILAVSLFLLYFLGFGISRVFMSVLGRRTLYNRPPGQPNGDTCWRAAEGYDLEMDRLVKQS